MNDTLTHGWALEIAITIITALVIGIVSLIGVVWKSGRAAVVAAHKRIDTVEEKVAKNREDTQAHLARIEQEMKLSDTEMRSDIKHIKETVDKLPITISEAVQKAELNFGNQLTRLTGVLDRFSGGKK